MNLIVLYKNLLNYFQLYHYFAISIWALHILLLKIKYRNPLYILLFYYSYYQFLYFTHLLQHVFFLFSFFASFPDSVCFCSSSSSCNLSSISQHLFAQGLMLLTDKILFLLMSTTVLTEICVQLYFLDYRIFFFEKSIFCCSIIIFPTKCILCICPLDFALQTFSSSDCLLNCLSFQF